MKTAYAGLRKSTQISGKKHQYYENVIQKIVNTVSQVSTEFIQYKRKIICRSACGTVDVHMLCSEPRLHTIHRICNGRKKPGPDAIHVVGWGSRHTAVRGRQTARLVAVLVVQMLQHHRLSHRPTRKDCRLHIARRHGRQPCDLLCWGIAYVCRHHCRTWKCMSWFVRHLPCSLYT